MSRPAARQKSRGCRAPIASHATGVRRVLALIASHATEVRRVTHEYFGMSDFDTRFSRFDTDADEKFGEPDPPIFETYQRDRASDAIEFSQASSPSARALERLKASASASDQEANKIRALFEQLS